MTMLLCRYVASVNQALLETENKRIREISGLNVVAVA